jgi:hypothetical protein
VSLNVSFSAAWKDGEHVTRFLAEHHQTLWAIRGG